MRGNLLLHRFACLTIMFRFAGANGVAKAEDLPAYMQPIAGHTASSPAETATKNMLALNTGMFELYGDAAKIFQSNILSQHPVILGLFSGDGGKFILYRPGQAPLDGAAGAGRLSAAEIHRPQHDGAGRSGGAVSEQSRRSGLARLDARLSQPDEVGAGWLGRDADAARSGGTTTGKFLRTISRSWTSVWPRARSPLPR